MKCQISKGCHAQGEKGLNYYIIIQAFKAKEIKTITVPQYEELTPKKMYSRIKDYIEDAIDYFPDYKDTPDYLPPKKFMWDIFGTLDYDLACTFVDYAMQQRNSVTNDKDKTIEIDEDIYKKLEASNFFSKKKGTAINMLTICRINKSIKRKRQEYESYDPNEEVNESKKMKLNDSPQSERNKKVKN